MKPYPSLDRLKNVLNYDPETGVFTWKRPAHQKTSGKLAGHKTKREYIYIGIDGEVYRAHRIAWLYYYGKPPINSIDHINGIRSDNRICNLRDVSNTVNTENQTRATAQNKSSGVLGVSREKNHRRWRAHIGVNGRQIHIGYFDTIEEAQKAYISKKRELHAGCTL